MTAYYNEIDPKAAEWLRELIKAGHIADGEVDERSIEDVTPNELAGYTQCHFFAGIGGWSLALRLAGWPDDRLVWTGSCPCQPFTTAGKGKGFDDERHLWPAWYWLIEQCLPNTVFGEQVASKDGRAWLDLVSTDLEAQGYTVGPASTLACGFGAPHKRQRLYWVADGTGDGIGAFNREPWQGLRQKEPAGGYSVPCDVANSSNFGWERRQETKGPARKNKTERGKSMRDTECGSVLGELVNSDSTGREPGQLATETTRHGGATITTSFWDECDWLPCRDGKSRPVEPGAFPLASRIPGRVGLLRGYGNAIVPQQAQAFIEAYLNS